MANVLFTQRCVRNCPYCFADPTKGPPVEGEYLSWENLIYLAGLFNTSGERRFHIVGGEPTLHPHFVEMVSYLIDRDFDVNVFTSGILSERQLSDADTALNSVSLERFSFTCNLNDPVQTPAPEGHHARLGRFLQVFGSRTAAGFNIYRPDFDLRFLFELILEHGLMRTIRLGIAHPVSGGNNAFLPLDTIDSTIERLFTFRPLFERLRIKPGFDCGFPKCRFSDEHLGWLSRQSGDKYDFVCNPVLDIGPDMNVWACFPLSTCHRRSVFDFGSLQEMQDYYRGLHGVFRGEVAGLYEECDTCQWREDGACSGGCLGHVLSRFTQEAPVRAKEIFR